MLRVSCGLKALMIKNSNMSCLRSGRSCFPPHVDVKRLGDVDLETARPGAVGCVHEPDTQQLVVVVTGPVEDHTGAGQGGDVAVWIGCALRQTHFAQIIWFLCHCNSGHLVIRCYYGNGAKQLRRDFLFKLHVSACEIGGFLPFLLQTPSVKRLICEWICCPAGSEEQMSQCECLCSGLFLSTH